MNDTKIVLSEKEIPQQWYNIQADLPEPLPRLLSLMGLQLGLQDLAPIFPMELIKQEVSRALDRYTRRYIKNL